MITLDINQAPKSSLPYVEIVGKQHVLYRVELWGPPNVGKFTRENVARWLDKTGDYAVGIYGWVDFHAVCGSLDIPWATEESKKEWEEAHKAQS
jgi:hypothetical protein